MQNNRAASARSEDYVGRLWARTSLSPLRNCRSVLIRRTAGAVRQNVRCRSVQRCSRHLLIQHQGNLCRFQNRCIRKHTWKTEAIDALRRSKNHPQTAKFLGQNVPRAQDLTDRGPPTATSKARPSQQAAPRHPDYNQQRQAKRPHRSPIRKLQSQCRRQRQPSD